MNQALALSSPLPGLKARATAMKARAAGLWRAYPRETLGVGVLAVIGAAAVAGSVQQASGPALQRPPRPRLHRCFSSRSLPTRRSR